MLLCSLQISLAGAAYNSMAAEDNITIPLYGTYFASQYNNISSWNWFASLSIPEHPDSLASYVDPTELESLQLSMIDLVKIDEKEEEIQFPKFGSPEYSYLPQINKEGSGMNGVISRSDISTSSPELQYIYKNDKTQRWLLDYSSSLDVIDEEEITYADSNIIEFSIDKINGIKPSPDNEYEDMLSASDSYDLHLISPERIARLYKSSIEADHIIGIALAGEENDQIINPSGDWFDSAKIDGLSRAAYSYSPETLPSPRDKKELKNYAIVVGIDGYEDRMKLHSCANDARSMADLMEEMGYDVVLLSDQTNEKPTKRKILDLAEEIKNKPDLGNVIFYFSGHGATEENNTFYLIPQDANKDISTYISEDELKQRIFDLKNFAMIIDACNSEGLSQAIGDGQLIIASSMYNESSNGEWTGSMSVFTSYLIKAIKQEKERSNKVLLQRCFERAYSDTVRWSRNHLMSQTPVLIDLTGGIYYIN